MSAGIQTDSVLSARLQIIRIYIREDGRLVIEFKTHAKFRGQCTTSTATFVGFVQKVSGSKGVFFVSPPLIFLPVPAPRSVCP